MGEAPSQFALPSLSLRMGPSRVKVSTARTMVQPRRPETTADCAKPAVGRGVTLTTDPTQDEHDAFGRLLAYAKTDARKVLQREQLRLGWAKVFVFERPLERVGEFRAVEQTAVRCGPRRVGCLRRRLPSRCPSGAPDYGHRPGTRRLERLHAPPDRPAVRD